MSDNDNDDDSFSSDSDDEFLTLREDGKGTVDREALIRKKLLESFYGKSSSHDDKKSAVESDDDDDDESADAALTGDQVASDDLDAAHFSAAAHTARHVLQSTVHQLLETEDHLACQVRTLDSSMQTLVYENYSRFIDATDAIRSIGVNVGANEAGLERLSRGMQRIHDTSLGIESTVGSLRDCVVEKLRVKRLLTRLETLLKLPQTLRDQIAVGKYRLATKSYLSAYSILSKHSAGFESLQRIELECHGILTEMLKDLRRKLLHWCGHGVDDDGDDDDDIPPPEAPKTVAEIFECAGTPILLLETTSTEIKSDDNEEEDKEEDAPAQAPPAATARFDPGFTVEQCKEMALSASLRLLERVLDTHHIELQEAQFAAVDPDAPRVAESKLVPTHVLDSILEASTLYGMSFGTAISEESSSRLAQFVMEAFSTFLQHVRGELLEQALLAQPSMPKPKGASTDEDEHDTDGDDKAYQHISTALTLLLQSVRQLASGLALPEVGINPDLASSLVDQTVGLTEAMVRRRVDQKFYTLRFRVVKDCLAPLCTRAMQQDDGEEQGGVLSVVQMASVALSDSLQLVDDTVRSILSEEAAAAAEDAAMLKQAVETSTKKFALWLAAAMEILAGCESSDPNLTLEAKADPDEGTADESSRDGANGTVSMGDSLSEISDDPTDPTQVVETALLELLEELDATGSRTTRSDMTLAIAEMCRVAERSVMDNISQSIATHGGRGKQRKAKGLFPSDGANTSSKADNANPTAERFRLAASRVLGLYAMNRGSDVADLLCMGLMELSQVNVRVEAPRAATWQVLEVVKLTSFDCADLFGGSKRASPVPETLEDEYSSYVPRQAARSGLVFDVERMFAEKVVVYPHPSELAEFTRNSVITTVLKVAFKAMVEYSRLLQFSSNGYRQMMVDVEFLKFMIPHFVKDEFLTEGSNARAALMRLLTDAINTAGERCSDKSVIANEGAENLINQARAVVRAFMQANSGSDGIVQRFTIPED